MRWRLLYGYTQGFQQLCGINAIMFYAPDILNTFFTEVDYLRNILNGINFHLHLVFYGGQVARGLSSWSLEVIMAFALVANAIMSSLDQTKTVGVMVLIFASLSSLVRLQLGSCCLACLFERCSLTATVEGHRLTTMMTNWRLRRSGRCVPDCLFGFSFRLLWLFLPSLLHSAL
jgi:hypothetical protein